MKDLRPCMRRILAIGILGRWIPRKDVSTLCTKFHSTTKMIDILGMTPAVSHHNDGLKCKLIIIEYY